MKNKIRKIIPLLLFCCPLLVSAQQGFTISGKIANLKGPAKVYLAVIQNGTYQNIDSVSVKNGTFIFKGQVSIPQPAILNLQRQSAGAKRQGSDQLSLFLENAKIKVIGKDSLNNAQVSGSITDQQRRALEASIAPLTQHIIRIQNRYANKPKEELFINGKPKADVAKASDSLRHFIEEIKRLKTQFVEDHPDSYYALYVYNTSILGSKFDPQKVEPLFLRFTDELRTSSLGKETLEKIQVAKRMTTGIKAIDFTQNDLNGNPFTLSSLRGKYVLVDFWASWCAPCRKENPNVIKAYQALKDKNFEIVGVSLDQSKPAWENAVQTDQLPWIHVSDLKGWKNEVAVLYGINSVPQNFLINPAGEIIGKNLRGDDLTEQLLSLMTQGGFTIKGKVGTVDAPAMVYLNYSENGVPVADSAVLQKGHFAFKGKLSAPTAASLTLKHDTLTRPRSRGTDYLRLYIENSEITVTSSDSIRYATVEGSTTNEEEKILRAWQRPYKKSADSLVAVYNALSPEERKDSTFQKSAGMVMRATQIGYDSVSRAFMAAYPNSYISLLTFKEVELAYNFDPDTAAARFARLSPAMRESATGKKLVAIIETGKKASIGRMAMDFQQNDIEGKPVRLSDFRGQYVLLDFWASWCVPCRAENPIMLAAYEKYKDRNFTILGVSLDDADGRNAWLGAVKHDRLPWTQISELKGFKSEAAVLYGVSAIPTNYLIDPSGKIIAKNLRGADLDKFLGTLFTKQ